MTDAPHEELLYSMADIQRVSRQGIQSVYAAIRAGHLATIVIGRRRYARPAAVTAWVDMLEARSHAGDPMQYRSREAMGDKRARRAG